MERAVQLVSPARGVIRPQHGCRVRATRHLYGKRETVIDNPLLRFNLIIEMTCMEKAEKSVSPARGVIRPEHGSGGRAARGLCGKDRGVNQPRTPHAAESSDPSTNVDLAPDVTQILGSHPGQDPGRDLYRGGLVSRLADIEVSGFGF